jgi:hypothetical protein
LPRRTFAQKDICSKDICCETWQNASRKKNVALGKRRMGKCLWANVVWANVMEQLWSMMPWKLRTTEKRVAYNFQ